MDRPPVRGDIEFCPSSLEKGSRSVRAFKLAIAEMYVKGIATRRVTDVIGNLPIETGLRANEIRTLTVSDIDFENNVINIKARNEKARRGASIPVEKSLSTLLKDFVATKLPSARALNVLSLTSAMLQVDLKEAGIEYKNERGYVDFHALRHTFGTWLAQSGVAPQVAQRLMRHSDPRLTQNLYTHLVISDLRSGADKLPDYTRAKEKQSATGTADYKAISTVPLTVPQTCAKGGFVRTSTDLKASTFETSQNTENPAYCTGNGVFDSIRADKKEKATVGFEPTNIGFANRRLRPLGYVAEEKL